MVDPETAVAATRCWVENVVIRMNLCPFARPVFEADKIRFAVSHATHAERALSDFATEFRRLDNEKAIETTLFVMPEGFAGFDEYLDLLELAEALLNDLGYEGVYQVASFHPEYRFQGSGADDPANYTNRSPYPMLHLIREESLERALTGYPDLAEIPVRNEKLTRNIGLAGMRNKLDACRK